MRARCRDGCEGCYYCEGGLFLCTTCGGAEASLPQDCPGERMSGEVEDAVQAGLVDYRDGVWLALGRAPVAC